MKKNQLINMTYHFLHRAERLAYRKRYYLLHREEIRAKARAYAHQYCSRRILIKKKNHLRILEINRAWQQKNREKCRAYSQKYNASEKGKMAAKIRNRKWTESHRVQDRLRVRLKEAFKMYSSGGKKYCSKKYGIDFHTICQHLGPIPNDGQEWHIDNIIPLSYFNFDDSEQIKAAFAPENHQWLEAKKNMSKRNRWIG
jgi:hypothetical protein